MLAFASGGNLLEVKVSFRLKVFSLFLYIDFAVHLRILNFSSENLAFPPGK